MLIRHISIPRQSIPISRKTQRDIETSDELRDYSNYLTRTLNPELPDHDVLISERTGHVSPAKQKVESGKGMLGRSESVLEREIPQDMQNFTNFNLNQQDQITEETSHKQRRIRSNVGFYKKQNEKSTKKIVRQLNNQVYLQTRIHKRDYSLTPILSKAYSAKNEVDNEQYDSGIVNNHAKSSIVHGDLYRTLQKIQAKNAKKQLIDPNRPLVHKKYTYSLPKTSFTPKKVQRVAEQTQTQRQDFIESKPLVKRISNHKDLSHLVSTDKINARKKNALPSEDQEAGERQDIVFEPINERKKQVRKTSEQQSSIVAKLQSETILSNKHVKINPIFPLSARSIPRQKIQVSYRTSLSELKEICALKEFDKVCLVMKIPEIFSYPLFTGLQDQGKLFSKSEELLKHLQINHKNDLSIKKYNNCILLIANYITVVWHYTGKRYLGGWKYDLLDDGHKNGLGLQWSPKNYVYYGEFTKGKRQGVGIMKNSENQVLAGLWHENKFLRPLSTNDINSNITPVQLQAEKNLV